jgi:hypothetical protein
MSEIDAKGIGLAAKDLVLGVGTVAAGATLGPAGAEGVHRAGGALDRILKMAGVADPRMDPAPAASVAPPSEQTAGSGSRVPGRSAPAGPVLGDAKVASEHLRGVGWPEGTVQQILQGPERGADSGPTSESAQARAPQSPFLFERAGYAPDLRDYDADALMLRGVGITTERLKPHEEG